MAGETRRNYPAILFFLLALAGFASSSPLHAQPAPDTAPPEVVPPPRFDITRFEVTGNTLLAADEIDRLVAPYTGKNKDFADIQRALETLEQAYRDRGYGVAQVILPEQDITRGVVQFRVLQPRIGRVLIEGNTRFDAANIRNSLPAVKEGETPNSREIARNLQMTAEHPAKQTNVLLRSGASEDQVDVAVKVTDERPWRRFFTLDNTGTGETGYLRMGLGFQHNNLFNRDHALTATYITSPDHIDDVTIFGLGYRIPYYHLKSTLEIVASYSDVSSGVAQGLNITGAGTTFGARWNYFLPKWGETEQKLAFGLDYRDFQNSKITNAATGQPPIDPATGKPFFSDVTIHPASLTYSALRRMTAADFSYYAGLVTNIPGGNDGDQAAFSNSRNGATENYMLLRYGLNYTRQFRSEWQMRFAVNGQHTDDALVSGEQFGLGGPDSVRGYQLREIAGDRGYSAQAELYTPDLSRKVGWNDDYRTRLLAFYDWGTIKRNQALASEIAQDSIASVGVGLRVTYKKFMSLRLDLAQILQQTASRENSSQRLSGALALVF